MSPSIRRNLYVAGIAYAVLGGTAYLVLAVVSPEHASRLLNAIGALSTALVGLVGVLAKAHIFPAPEVDYIATVTPDAAVIEGSDGTAVEVPTDETYAGDLKADAAHHDPLA